MLKISALRKLNRLTLHSHSKIAENLFFGVIVVHWIIKNNNLTLKVIILLHSFKCLTVHTNIGDIHSTRLSPILYLKWRKKSNKMKYWRHLRIPQWMKWIVIPLKG